MKIRCEKTRIRCENTLLSCDNSSLLSATHYFLKLQANVDNFWDNVKVQLLSDLQVKTEFLHIVQRDDTCVDEDDPNLQNLICNPNLCPS